MTRPDLRNVYATIHDRIRHREKKWGIVFSDISLRLADTDTTMFRNVRWEKYQGGDDSEFFSSRIIWPRDESNWTPLVVSQFCKIVFPGEEIETFMVGHNTRHFVRSPEVVAMLSLK